MSTEVIIVNEPIKGNGSEISQDVFHAILEGILVILIVMAVSALCTWMAVHRAHVKEDAPIVIQDQPVTLKPIQADLYGELLCGPREMEDQREGFSYAHGRKIVAERSGRKIIWQDMDGVSRWRIQIEQAGDYQVLLRYQAETTCHWQINIGEAIAKGEIKARRRARDSPLSDMRLESGIALFELKMPKIGEALIIEHVSLKRIDSKGKEAR